MLGFGPWRARREIEALRQQVKALGAETERLRLDVLALGKRLDAETQASQETTAALFERIERTRPKP